MGIILDTYTSPRQKSATPVLIRHASAIVAAVAFFLLMLPRPIDPDLWWHLRTGQVIVDTMRLPAVPFLSTSSTPWILHEWGAEVAMWLVYSWGGLPLLGIVFGAAVAVPIGWLVASQPTTHQRTAAMWLAIGAGVASYPLLGMRPQMFTIIGLAVFLAVLETYRREEEAGLTTRALPLIGLMLLMVVWANVHSGFMVGLLVMAIYSAADLWRGKIELASAWCGVALASLITPYGFGLWLYPFQTLTSEPMRQYIAEWLPPTPATAEWWPFYALLLLSLALLARHAEKIPAETWLILGGAMLASLLSLRHIPFAGVAAVALLPRHWPAGWATPRPSAWLAIALLFSASLSAPHLVAAVAQSEQSSYPVAAVDYLAANGAGTVRIFNEYHWGGYLIWRGFPPAIDGRADVHGDAVASTARARRGLPGWEQALEGYTLALLRPATALGELLKLAGWELVYSDDMAEIWRK